MGIPRLLEDVDTSWEQPAQLSPIAEHHEEDKVEERQQDNDPTLFDGIEPVEQHHTHAAIGNAEVFHPSMGFLPRPSSAEGAPNKGFKFGAVRQIPLNMSRSKKISSTGPTELPIKPSIEHSESLACGIYSPH